MHAAQILRDKVDCTWLLVKANKLRMMLVAFGLSLKHSLRKQGFAPKCDKTLAVKVTGMQAPKTHSGYYAALQCLTHRA